MSSRQGIGDRPAVHVSDLGSAFVLDLAKKPGGVDVTNHAGKRIFTLSIPQDSINLAIDAAAVKRLKRAIRKTSAWEQVEDVPRKFLLKAIDAWAEKENKR